VFIILSQASVVHPWMDNSLFGIPADVHEGHPLDQGLPMIHNANTSQPAKAQPRIGSTALSTAVDNAVPMARSLSCLRLMLLIVCEQEKKRSYPFFDKSLALAFSIHNKQQFVCELHQLLS
jgi:hypothetical protein